MKPESMQVVPKLMERAQANVMEGMSGTFVERHGILVEKTATEEAHPGTKRYDVWGRQYQQTPVLQDPVNFPQEHVGIFQMLDPFNRNHQIIAVRGQWQSLVQIGTTESLTEPALCTRIDIQANSIEASGLQRCCESALAARRICHGATGADLVQAQDSPQNRCFNNIEWRCAPIFGNDVRFHCHSMPE